MLEHSLCSLKDTRVVDLQFPVFDDIGIREFQIQNHTGFKILPVGTSIRNLLFALLRDVGFAAPGMTAASAEYTERRACGRWEKRGNRRAAYALLAGHRPDFHVCFTHSLYRRLNLL